MKVSRACMRFICGCLLIAVPRFACHQPRLKGSQAGYCSIATTTSSIAGIDEGKPRVHAVHLRLFTDCCIVLRATSPATSSSGAGSNSSSIAGRATARWSWCKVSRMCLCGRFLWGGVILIAVPCFTCHQPRLEGSRASYYRTATATTTSSGGGSGGCIAG
ncbi:hypothetical protein PF003_g33881 [Phytophthora fragariae]|nr:hypothetical protein PF003_g33881 [Phytophthora fragariae]